MSRDDKVRKELMSNLCASTECSGCIHRNKRPCPVDRLLSCLNEIYKVRIDEGKLRETIVKHIASNMKPSITFDDQAYKMLGDLAPKGIKSLADAIAEKVEEWMK